MVRTPTGKDVTPRKSIDVDPARHFALSSLALVRGVSVRQLVDQLIVAEVDRLPEPERAAVAQLAAVRR